MSAQASGRNEGAFRAALRMVAGRLFPRRLDEHMVYSALQAEPGIAGVEDVQITECRGGRPPVSAYVRVSADEPDPDVVLRRAAHALRKRLPVPISEVLLVRIDGTRPRRGVLITDAEW